jgi:hypothetical protein
MTFGRPAMISKISSGAVPLPVLVDDEFIPVDATVDPTQPTQKLSMMAFYAKTLELYEIMNEVLLSLHKPVSDDGPEETHQFSFTNTNTDGEHTIFELDHSLTRWAQGLPAHLRTGSTEGAHNPVFFRQGIVLNARFVNKTPRTRKLERILTNHHADSCTFAYFYFDPFCQSTALCAITRQAIL